MVIQKVTLSPCSLPSLICAVPPGSPSTVPVISESPFSASLIGTSCSLYLNDPAHVPVISVAGAIAAIKRSSPVNVRWRFIRTHSIKGHPLAIMPLTIAKTQTPAPKKADGQTIHLIDAMRPGEHTDLYFLLRTRRQRTGSLWHHGHKAVEKASLITDNSVT